jgi:tRNA-2-methylthio-N6-dimethylallyladenosine synthase
MNRKYTVASYLEKVDQLRKYCPDISVTTDIIVGFPGETDEDFESTMELLENVRYHSSFSFKYSDRPHTKSAAFTDKVEKNTKIARLSRLQKRQEQITLERNQHYIGKTLEVMVEGESKNAAGQISGRTGTNHIVNFTTAPSPAHFQPGELVDVVIEEACLHSLRGKVVQ